MNHFIIATTHPRRLTVHKHNFSICATLNVNNPIKTRDDDEYSVGPWLFMIKEIPGTIGFSHLSRLEGKEDYRCEAPRGSRFLFSLFGAMDTPKQSLTDHKCN